MKKQNRLKFYGEHEALLTKGQVNIMQVLLNNEITTKDKAVSFTELEKMGLNQVTLLRNREKLANYGFLNSYTKEYGSRVFTYYYVSEFGYFAFLKSFVHDQNHEVEQDILKKMLDFVPLIKKHWLKINTPFSQRILKNIFFGLDYELSNINNLKQILITSQIFTTTTSDYRRISTTDIFSIGFDSEKLHEYIKNALAFLFYYDIVNELNSTITNYAFNDLILTNPKFHELVKQKNQIELKEFAIRSSKSKDVKQLKQLKKCIISVIKRDKNLKSIIQKKLLEYYQIPNGSLFDEFKNIKLDSTQIGDL